MATNFAVMVYAPGAGNSQSTGAASSAAVDVGAGTTRIIVTCDQDAHIRFGTSAVGAAVATDWPIWARIPQVFDITNAGHYFRVIRDSANGTLYWALVQ